jgi:predicted aspartyl protease
MGKFLTDLTITNRVDEANAEKGLIPAEQVRSVTLDDVLVDIGSTTLCLPEDVIAALGLGLMREVTISTAQGIGHARMFQDAKVSLLGRQSNVECVELPRGAQPLLGVLPLEALGIELDLQRQALRLLPDTGRDTFYTV